MGLTLLRQSLGDVQSRQLRGPRVREREEPGSRSLCGRGGNGKRVSALVGGIGTPRTRTTRKFPEVG